MSSEVWSERAEAYRESEAHRQGRDLELFAEWAAGMTVLDVASGGGHVAGACAKPAARSSRATRRRECGRT